MSTQHHIISPMASEEEFQEYARTLEETLDALKMTLLNTTYERYAKGQEVMTQQSVCKHMNHLFSHLENAYLFEAGEEKNISINVAHAAFRAVLLAHAWGHRYGVSPSDMFNDDANKP